MIVIVTQNGDLLIDDEFYDTLNWKGSYQSMNIPMSTEIEVSADPIKDEDGVISLVNDDDLMSYYESPESFHSLRFCNNNLELLFGSIPREIHFKLL